MDEKKENNKKVTKTKAPKKEVTYFNSLKGKVNLLLLFSVVASVFLIVLATVPSSRSALTTTVQNYMLDLADAKGQAIDDAITYNGEENILTADALGAMVGRTGLTNVDSSYAYVVSNDGTMLYHPTADKIGSPVENSVVKGLVAEIQGGKVPASAIVSYEFKGAVKYASYYVSQREGTPFILVVSGDEDEVLSSVSSMTSRSFLFGIIIAILMGVIGAIVMSISLKPVDQLDTILSNMANLDLRPDENLQKLTTRKDEFGVMSRAIKNLREQLASTVTNIKGQSERLFSSSDTMLKNAANMSETSGQVDQAVSDIAEGATSQADSTQKATDTVVRIGEMIEAANRAVDDLNEVSNVMTDAQNTASDILSELDQINVQTTEAIDEIARQTAKTNESTAKIQAVTALISSIAEETNLLSLNASIEAARAGEAGRGFAVVAEEIGKLADQSNQSTKQIEEIITQLVSDAQESVKTMESVRQITSRQSEDITRTGEAFAKIAAGIEASNECVNNISNQMREMDLAREEVVDTVESLSAIAEENAASTQQSSASVTQMNEIAGDIKEDSGNLRDIAEVLRDNMNAFQS